MKLRRGIFLAAIAPLILVFVGIGAVLFLLQGGFAPMQIPRAAAAPISATVDVVEHGKYLSRIGNCGICHTTRGGAEFAGGRAFDTPYGTVYSTNLTPDQRTGLGDWSLEEFRHVLRNGVSRHGFLYPVFPYENFSKLVDADIDALFAYLRSVPSMHAPAQANALEFPESRRGAILLWRMFNYRPQNFVANPAQSAVWNRGRYLVDALGHCAFCHSTRGALASLPASGYLAGGVIPVQGWYAPALDDTSLTRFSIDELAEFLRAGTSTHGAAYGPMAEVVLNGLQYLTAEDAVATATYLKLIRVAKNPPAEIHKIEHDLGASAGDGLALYEKHCADCHGKDGRGKENIYPPLRDAVSVLASDPMNAVRLVLYGGVVPTTALNPRPYSMPPFAQQLSSTEVVAILNYIRQQWGKQAATLTPADIVRMQGIVLD
ncbi:c-type cytochrome [Pseudolysobacter antarcticus]|nr:cytochrome c [Pseudolysobacter antarcticus]